MTYRHLEWTPPPALAAGEKLVTLAPAQDLKKEDPPPARSVELRFSRPPGGMPMLANPHAVGAYLITALRSELDDPREMAWVLALSMRNRLLTPPYVLSIGSDGYTTLDVRNVYRFALAAGADRIIVAHSHPSGSTEPSPDDGAVTSLLQRAGQVLGVELIDHVILAGCHRDEETPRYFSFREAGRL